MSELLPLWKAHPSIPWKSIGWRMGEGEDYRWKFNDWFRGLTDAERVAYEEKFPEPDDWRGYYDAFRAATEKLKLTRGERS